MVEQSYEETSEDKRSIIALAGNPNSGKTTLFNALTGARQRVSNYPGVTVERVEGDASYEGSDFTFVDLPGTYSLTAYSQEEVVARDFIVGEKPKVVVNVVDASNLERNLYLTLQVAEMGVPMVVVLNMHDIARQRGTVINEKELSRLLGVPVVLAVARKKEGISELFEALTKAINDESSVVANQVEYGPRLDCFIRRLAGMISSDNGLRRCPSRWMAVKLLEQDEKAHARVSAQAEAPSEVFAMARELVHEFEKTVDDELAAVIAEHRYGYAAGLVRRCCASGAQEMTMSDRLDRFLCHRIFGPLMVVACIYITFSLTFAFADGWEWIPWPGGWITPCGIVGLLFEEWLPSLTAPLHEGPVKSLLEDGVIGGVGGVLGFVPIIFFMFLLLGFIEDSGYIARIAFVLDRVLRTFGMQGKSILAMIVSGGIAGGCAVPGVMATRILREEKDRLTTMLVVPFMNCGAKIPVFAMLAAAFFSTWKGGMLWLLALISWSVALVAALVIRKTVVRGEQTPFVMELPQYHLPTIGALLSSAGHRSWMYAKKAGTIILAVNIVLWAAMYFPRMDTSEHELRLADHNVKLVESAANINGGGMFAGEKFTKTVAVVDGYLDACESGDIDAIHELESEGESFELAKLVRKIKSGEIGEAQLHRLLPLATLYVEWKNERAEIEGWQASLQLRHSIAGRVGSFLEPASRWAGFDWRDNIALVGGFAAKEIIISCMATAYSMAAGDVEQSESGDSITDNPLSQKLAADPQWNPLRAFALIIFIMVYAPCLVTVSVIWRESGSWKWALFSVCYSTVLAFVLATIVYQAGNALHIGVG